MPYKKISDLPPNVRKYPKNLQKIFLHVFNSMYASHNGDEGRAFAAAYSVMKKYALRHKTVKKSFGMTPLGFTVGKSSVDDVVFDCVLTTTDVDAHGQNLSRNALYKIASDLEYNPIFGDIEHANLEDNPDPILKLPSLKLVSSKIVDDKLYATVSLLNHPYRKQIIDRIMDGTLNGMSIEITYDSPNLVDGTYIDGSVNWFSLVHTPANSNAQIIRLRGG
ncbi:MAG: hypothetical protein COS71_03000 [Candidatus Moranbacteria bacterium CG06_land_8_20_14_3_00_40_12]|nr:MAG: hypothetical protein COS71_03000 [Candidatus Moranbacteria bacterium CG06_land_8_20_14_3_00_40_12]